MPVDLNAPEIKSAIEEAVNSQVKEKLEAETGGLKAKNTEIMDELKALRKKFDGIDPEEVKRLKEQERNAKDKDSDPVELRKRIEEEFAPKLATAEKRGDDAEGKLRNLTIDNHLNSALAEAGVAKEFHRAVKADLVVSRKFDVKDDGVTVDGKPVADFVKTWATADGKAFISAVDNSGGGAKGGGGGAGSKKISEMNRTEKADFIKEKGLPAWQEKIKNES